MTLTNKEIKQRYFDRKKASATVIKCACGCGENILDVDDYGRPKTFVNGHNGRKYSNKYEYKKVWRKKNLAWRRQWRRKRGAEKKIILIKTAGGKCTKCGLEYDGRNGGAFQFHHRDPSGKDFNISKGLDGYSIEDLIDEAKKCDLLCANCHFILHMGEY